LCGLPIHAAGPYARGKKNLPDLYISSYTSTLSASIKGRSGVHDRSVAPELLIIAQPDPTIPTIQEEVDQIQKLGYFGSLKILLGEEADHQSIFTHYIHGFILLVMGM
jgi:hypothetical protein